MAKKKKRKSRRPAPPPKRPRSKSKRRQNSKWWVPMLAGAAALVVLVVGGSALMDTLFPRDETRPTRPSERHPAKPPGTPKPATPRGKVSGVLAHLPRGDVAGMFSDANLVRTFEKARDDLQAGKPPMPIRRQLEKVLPASQGDPGREHLLVAAAYTALETRDGDAASRYLETLREESPDNTYGSLVDVMALDATIVQEARNRRSQALDSTRVRDTIERAQEIAASGLGSDTTAYALFVAAKGYGLLGEADRAATAYLEVAGKYPESTQAPSALLRAADMLRKQGSIERAIETLDRLIASYPRAKATREARKTIRELRLIGNPAPELLVEEWVNGEPSPLSRLQGKVVLLAFWQTWCPHCREELPKLSRLYDEYRDRGLVVIGATKNDRRQDEAKLADFLKEHPVSFPVARVNPRSSNDYAVTGIPAGVLIDRKGVIRERAHPNSLTRDIIDSLLAEK